MKASLVSVASTGAPAEAAPPARAADEDMHLRPAEPDFTLIALPTRFACLASRARSASRTGSRSR